MGDHKIKYFIDDAISEKIEQIISDYNGGEIFFGCSILENGAIVEAEPICYGNDDAVLAPYEIVKKYNGILHNHPSGNVKPSEVDLNYANYLSNEGIGFFIIDNKVKKLTTVVPPIINKKNKKLITDEIEEIFSINGKINEIKSDYEYREGQVLMSKLITKAFNDNSIALIEAGTGIGKSLAYLIPAFLWVEKNDERIVISTNTINLQSQLLNKDIPLVKKILNSNIEAVLIKGRRNYLCKLKLFNIQEELEFDNSSVELNNILNWAKKTKTGSIDELNFVPQNDIWERVSSDIEFCIGPQCDFFDGCFLQIARRKASESNILVVNHHILFADIEIRSSGRGLDENILLPPYRKIIIDEAHNIEKSANSFFSSQFSKSGFYKFVNFYKSKNNKGFLNNLISKFSKSNNSKLKEAVELITVDILDNFNFLYNNSFEIFEEINNYIHKLLENDNITSENISNYQHWIKEDEWKSQFFIDYVINPLKNLSSLLENFLKSFNKILNFLKNLDEISKEKYLIDIKLIKAYSKKIEAYYDNLVNIINQDIKNRVLWIEVFGSYESPLFNLISSPLNTNELLYEKVHTVFDSIIFTSATLTVDKNFKYFKDLSGLNLINNNEKQVIECSIDSPFDYYNNVLFVAPLDIPDPASPAYNEHLNNFIEKTIEATNGSSFILFTSYNQLKKSYESVAPKLKEKGLKSFYQGEMQKEKLLENFINDIHSNLFATDSFWEGVDAPGDTLRYVILTKLPFRMPTEPIEMAKAELIKNKGLNPFIELTLPSAVIKFRQGFGRLIRTKYDYGVVALLDSRSLTKSYGKTFFRSLPKCQFFSGETEEVIKYIVKHLDNKKNNNKSKLNFF